MRLDRYALGLAAALIVASPAAASPPVRWQYVSPVPGSRLISPGNNIVMRLGPVMDPGTIDARVLSVVGARSGSHSGALVLSDDAKTLVFRPDQPFSPGETVRVSLGPGLATLDHQIPPPLEFEFSVSAAGSPRRSPSFEDMFPDLRSRSPGEPAARTVVPVKALTPLPCDTLPPGYPQVLLLTSDDPDPGAVFMAPIASSGTSGHLLILDNLATPLFYRRLDGLGSDFDFKVQPNGLLTYFQTGPSKFYALDSTYAVVDSFATGNGYKTDLHDMQLLPNGHALLMSYDPEPVDMSSVVPGGNPNATVIGLVLQEIDAAKNVVFQWRSWDHFEITDCVSPGVNMTGSSVDYVHGNAVAEDLDGNLLLSSRHMDEITKIDRQTGDLIWRLGPHAKNNEFSIVNDARGFSHQHDIRRLPNGHITMFDNGNYIAPVYSRALEYDLDENNMVATEVWEHRNTPDVYGPFTGDVQRRAGGGTTIGWGGTMPNPKMTELHSDGSLAFQVGFADSFRYFTYRAFRFPWRTTRFVAAPDSLDFGQVTVGQVETRSLTVRNTSASAVTITCFVSTDSAFSVPASVPFTLAPGDTAAVDVAFAPTTACDCGATLYVRQVTNQELVARTVALHGAGIDLAGVPPRGGSGLRLASGRPNPFDKTTAIGFTIPRSGRVRLEILDVHGRRIATLADEVRPAGSYEVTWAPRGKAVGVYFCRLTAGDAVLTRKLVLER